MLSVLFMTVLNFQVHLSRTVRREDVELGLEPLAASAPPPERKFDWAKDDKSVWLWAGDYELIVSRV